MSLQPNNLCKLRQGKALAAFPSFVDTFNWMVDFCANLIGEAEDPAQSQSSDAPKARVDRTVSDHPVIRISDGGAVDVIGTDGSSARAVKSIKFQSGEDSKSRATVADDGEGGVTVAIDVF